MIRLSGWGRFPVADCQVTPVRGAAEAAAATAQSSCLIARGNGRAYGDAALQPRRTLDMRPSDRLIAFDAESGTVTCEAGMMLADVIDIFLPRGWFPPVTPGTRFVTIGGMIAADVHGKNHHKDGGFSHYVDQLTLLLADGRVIICSPVENAALFHATCGGMGLTGVILTASFRLRPVASAYIVQHTLRADDLDAAMDLFEQHQDAAYSVAWLDCLSAKGRAIFQYGDHALPTQLDNANRVAPFAIRQKHARSLPFDAPSILLNRWTAKLFNALYYHLPRPARQFVDYRAFFYPLDNLGGWNRLYGKRGFVQYQCVIPRAQSRDGIPGLLAELRLSGVAPFLAVLKLMGPQGDGPLSFPLQGYTLALDFPATPKVLNLLDRLDAITLAHGGRIYLAKDARASAATIAASYPRLAEFKTMRAAACASLLSERLDL